MLEDSSSGGRCRILYDLAESIAVVPLVIERAGGFELRGEIPLFLPPFPRRRTGRRLISQPCDDRFYGSQSTTAWPLPPCTPLSRTNLLDVSVGSLSRTMWSPRRNHRTKPELCAPLGFAQEHFVRSGILLVIVLVPSPIQSSVLACSRAQRQRGGPRAVLEGEENSTHKKPQNR